MLTIPTQPVPNQTLQTVVANQNVTIILSAKRSQGMFVDIIADGVTLVTGVLGLDVVPLVPTDYLGFAGNFFFVDTQGNSDPLYTGLGTRFQLVYLTADEYALLSQ